MPPGQKAKADRPRAGRGRRRRPTPPSQGRGREPRGRAPAPPAPRRRTDLVHGQRQRRLRHQLPEGTGGQGLRAGRHRPPLLRLLRPDPGRVQAGRRRPAAGLPGPVHRRHPGLPGQPAAGRHPLLGQPRAARTTSASTSAAASSSARRTRAPASSSSPSATTRRPARSAFSDDCARTRSRLPALTRQLARAPHGAPVRPRGARGLPAAGPRRSWAAGCR